MIKDNIKNISCIIALLLVFTIIAFLGGETVVRLLFKDEISLMPRYHADAQYGEFTLRKIRPNSDFWHTSVDGSWQFVTNSQGFRNYADVQYEKPPCTMRVLSIGDSHTQGYEVRQEHTFSAVIERYLRREGYQAEVIKAGVSGFSIANVCFFCRIMPSLEVATIDSPVLRTTPRPVVLE